MADTLHHLLVVWMKFVLDWGYFGVFLMMAFESTALPIPAEIVIPPAAYWAAQGRFNVVLRGPVRGGRDDDLRVLGRAGPLQRGADRRRRHARLVGRLRGELLDR